MRPCTGIQGVCPPLCTWSETLNGTYTLADIQRFHYTMDEMCYYKSEAVNEQRN